VMSPALIEWMKRSTVEIAAASSALTRNASLDGEGLALAATALWLGTGLEVSAPDGRVVGGEEVVITRRGEEVASLVPVRRSSARRLGMDRGRFVVPDDFDEPLPDELLDAFER